MPNVRYSPLPIEDYRGTGGCEKMINSIIDLDYAEACWNMIWLSQPDIDLVPSAGKNWSQVFMPKPALVGAIVTDVYEDDVLRQRLLLSPAEFLQWWKRDDATIYDAYALEGSKWVETVTLRLEEASLRLSPIVQKTDNVIQVRFGRAA